MALAGGVCGVGVRVDAIKEGRAVAVLMAVGVATTVGLGRTVLAPDDLAWASPGTGVGGPEGGLKSASTPNPFGSKPARICGVAVAVGDELAPAVVVLVGVSVAVRVAVAVGFGVFVGVGVPVAVLSGVPVAVGVGVYVGVGVFVKVGVAVLVAVGVGVSLGVGV